MLRHLQIQNFAILDLITLDFTSGLQVITGETGAGKSIMAGALSLILGARAEGNMLKDRTKNALSKVRSTAAPKKKLSAFSRKRNSTAVKNWYYAGKSVRRKIPGLRQRYPVNLDQLRRLSVLLVDLHQQFDTLQLGDSDFQLAVLDALAGHQALLGQYRTAFRGWQQVKRRLEEMQRQRLQAEQEKDYRAFCSTNSNRLPSGK